MRVNLLILLTMIVNTILVQSGVTALRCNKADAHTPLVLLQDRATSYAGTYHQAWELIKDNYYNRHALSEWSTWEHKFDGKLHTAGDLEKALKVMLRTLGDDYTYCLKPSQCVEPSTVASAPQKSVQSRVISGDIGYLRLGNFYGDDIEDDFRKCLSDMSNVTGYVLDLRGNHGGYIEKAQRLFAMMADQGMFMTYAGFQDGNSDSMEMRLTRSGWDILQNGDRKLEPRETDAIGGKPVIVLVNSDTRSAAELLTGALRQNNKAIVIGTRTFGKGILQDRYELDNGLELKVTTARYFLPNGENIHNKGLDPDLLVAESTAGDGQLDRAIEELHRPITSASSGTESERLLSHNPDQTTDSNSL